MRTKLERFLDNEAEKKNPTVLANSETRQGLGKLSISALPTKRSRQTYKLSVPESVHILRGSAD